MKQPYILLFFLLCLCAGIGFYVLKGQQKRNGSEPVQEVAQGGAEIQKQKAPTEGFNIEEPQSVDEMLAHGEKAVPALIKILQTKAASPFSTESMEEWRHTVTVMEMLAEWKAEQALDVLNQMLTTSGDLSAIYNAARTVGKIGGKTSFTTLTTVLAESDNSQDKNATHRKRAAILGLGLCGNTQAVPLLIQEMQDEKNDDFIRVCAAGSLGLLGDQSGLQIVLEATDSTDPQLRLRSIEMIGAIGAPSAIKQLEEIINSQAPYVYRVAAKTSMMMIEAQQLSDQEQIKYLAENLVKFHRMTAFVWWGTSRLKALNTEESKKALQSLSKAEEPFLRDTARLKLQTIR
jgi:HEAT repeat protein